MLIPGQFRIDIFEGIQKTIEANCEFFVLDKTINELESIIEGKTKKSRLNDKTAAKIGKELIKKKKVKVIKTKEGKTDDLLVEYSAKGYIIATQDKELIKRIKQNKGKLLIMRQKGYFMLK